jgi:hypothetical protein
VRQRGDQARLSRGSDTARDGFAGRIYPINPRASEIQGLRAYPDLASVPGHIDLALVCTAAATVPDIVEQCGRKEVKGAVVLALGFSESGAEGRDLERRALESARRWNMRLIGPNTSGIFNAHCGLNFVGFADLRKGGIGIVSQSGNVALALVTEGHLNAHIGFSTYIGVGNESDLRFHDYLAHLGADAETTAIAMYVEGFKDRCRSSIRLPSRAPQARRAVQGSTEGRRPHIAPVARRRLRGRQSMPAGRRCGRRTLGRNPSCRRVPVAAAANALASRRSPCRRRRTRNDRSRRARDRRVAAA